MQSLVSPNKNTNMHKDFFFILRYSRNDGMNGINTHQWHYQIYSISWFLSTHLGGGCESLCQDIWQDGVSGPTPWPRLPQHPSWALLLRPLPHHTQFGESKEVGVLDLLLCFSFKESKLKDQRKLYKCFLTNFLPLQLDRGRRRLGQTQQVEGLWGSLLHGREGLQKSC